MAGQKQALEPSQLIFTPIVRITCLKCNVVNVQAIPGKGPYFTTQCNIIGQIQFEGVQNKQLDTLVPNDNLLFRILCRKCCQETITQVPSYKFIIKISEPLAYTKIDRKNIKPFIVRKLKATTPILPKYGNSLNKAPKPEIKQLKGSSCIKSKIKNTAFESFTSKFASSHDKLSKLDQLFEATKKKLEELRARGIPTTVGSLSQLYNVPAWVSRNCKGVYRHMLYMSVDRNGEVRKTIVGCYKCKRLEMLNKKIMSKKF